MKFGDKIVYVNELTGNDLTLNKGIVTDVYQDDYIEVDGQLVHKLYVYPVAYQNEIKQILLTRAELLKQYGDSLHLVYDLRNKIAREASDV